MVPQPSTSDTIIERLGAKLNQARREGFKIRLEFLDGEQASWCEIAGIPTIFVDQSQTAAEQLRQLEDVLADFHRQAVAPGSASGGDRTRAA